MKNVVELPRQPRSLSRLRELLAQCEDKRDFDRIGLSAEEEQLLADAHREANA
jgi:hypothetical protein